MEVELYPWRRYKDMGEALAVAVPVLVSLGVVEAGGGYSAVDVAAAEQRLGRPLPADVREFYRAARPTDVFANDSQREFGFYPFDADDGLAWRSMDGAEPPTDWTGATGLALGQSAGGDAFWWVEGHRTIPDGGIVLIDHELLTSDVMFAYFARSFREFIGKLAYFRNLYSYEKDPLFRQEYLELNPTAKM